MVLQRNPDIDLGVVSVADGTAVMPSPKLRRHTSPTLLRRPRHGINLLYVDAVAVICWCLLLLFAALLVFFSRSLLALAPCSLAGLLLQVLACTCSELDLPHVDLITAGIWVVLIDVLGVLGGGLSLARVGAVEEERWCFAPVPPAAVWLICLGCDSDSTCMQCGVSCVLACMAQDIFPS